MPDSPRQFDHEKLDVYRVSLDYVAWADDLILDLAPRYHNSKDQLERSSESITNNIAEGNGKRLGRDRERFFEIARGSATEAAATLDILVSKKGATRERVETGKGLLFRIVSMLVRLAPPNGAPRRSGTSTRAITSTKYEYDTRQGARTHP